jgi:hypothetical protein
MSYTPDTFTYGLTFSRCHDTRSDDGAMREVDCSARDGFENSPPHSFYKSAGDIPERNLSYSGTREKDFVSLKDIWHPWRRPRAAWFQQVLNDFDS